MSIGPPIDLVVLSADRNIEYALKGLIENRQPALRIRALSVEWITHPDHDPGCLRTANNLLAAYRLRAAHCLVVFDHEGSGGETRSRQDCELDVQAILVNSGWNTTACAAVAIAPEIEAWVWSDSPHVATTLGWKSDNQLRQWLVNQGWVGKGETKPAKPKEAVEAALYQSRKQRSSSLYAELARKVSLERCIDSSFGRLKEILANWFPAT